MNEYWRFFVATIIGTMLGVVLYRAFGDKKLPISSSIGIALGGAGMGGFSVMLAPTIYGLDKSALFLWGFPCLVATLGALGTQKNLSNWTTPPQS
jgi:uncharacterized membrane protein YdjX (TVP38/TMEM64 family)